MPNATYGLLVIAPHKEVPAPHTAFEVEKKENWLVALFKRITNS